MIVIGFSYVMAGRDTVQGSRVQQFKAGGGGDVEES
jgi:hypothetical protein